MEDKNINFKVYNSSERIKLFANELNDISNPKLQEFAIRLLLNAPDYFLQSQHHPQVNITLPFLREQVG